MTKRGPEPRAVCFECWREGLIYGGAIPSVGYYDVPCVRHGSAEAEARRAWERYCASGKKPADIPARPDLVYAAEWKGWVDWIGGYKIAD